MTKRRDSSIFRPTRHDQRTARQILANQTDGVACPVIAGLAAGPLIYVVRFLAGYNLTFVFHARDEQHRIYSAGAPSADPIALLIRRLLDDRSANSSAGDVPSLAACQPSHFADVDAIRSPWIESAIEQLVDGLLQRNLIFTLGWQLPGETRARLDCTLGLRRDYIDEWLKSFLSECMGVSACDVGREDSGKEVVSHA